jgi:hypothetical protein
MGKKKSKIAKAKQAKAKHGSGKNKRTIPSSLGGVSMAKGSNSKFQQQIANGNVVKVVEGNNNKASTQSSSFGKKFEKPKAKAVFLSSSPLPPHPSSDAASKTNGYDEQADFARQVDSLQERQAASRHAVSKQKKSTLLKEGGAVSTLIQGFQPPSFQVEKSTNDLLHETLDRMQSMSGVGQPRPSAESLPTPVRNNQSWATVSINPETLADKNPFDALQEYDEDEDESDNEYRQNPIIQMAPPSFTLLPRITPTPATTPLREPYSTPLHAMPTAIDDIDPDL